VTVYNVYAQFLGKSTSVKKSVANPTRATAESDGYATAGQPGTSCPRRSGDAGCSRAICRFAGADRHRSSRQRRRRWRALTDVIDVGILQYDDDDRSVTSKRPTHHLDDPRAAASHRQPSAADRARRHSSTNPLNDTIHCAVFRAPASPCTDALRQLCCVKNCFRM